MLSVSRGPQEEALELDDLGAQKKRWLLSTFGVSLRWLSSSVSQIQTVALETAASKTKKQKKNSYLLSANIVPRLRQ